MEKNEFGKSNIEVEEIVKEAFEAMEKDYHNLQKEWERIAKENTEILKNFQDDAESFCQEMTPEKWNLFLFEFRITIRKAVQLFFEKEGETFQKDGYSKEWLDEWKMETERLEESLRNLSKE